MEDNVKKGISRLISGLTSEQDVIKTLRPDGLTAKEEELIFALQRFATQQKQETAEDIVELDPDAPNTFAALGVDDEGKEKIETAIHLRMMSVMALNTKFRSEIMECIERGEMPDLEALTNRKEMRVEHQLIPLIKMLRPHFGNNPFAIALAAFILGNKFGSMR